MAGSNTGTIGLPLMPVAGVVTVIVTDVVSVKAVPFKVSLPFPLFGKTFPAGYPVVPFCPVLAVNVSSCANIVPAVTVMVTVAGSQFAGFNVSHKL